MQKIGVIDIGSNSIRLIIVEVGEYTYKLVDELKDSVRLGADVEEGQSLSQDKIEETIKTLRMFRSLCDSMRVTTIIAVATAAVRKASNGEEFVKQVKEETGLDIQILSGTEEAFFAYTGVVSSVEIDNALIMDIGGGSTELILVNDKELVESVSLPFGSISLTQKFNLAEDMSEVQAKELREFLLESFRGIPWLKKGTFTQIVGVGGTFRNFGKIDRCIKKYPLNIAHSYNMTNTDIYNIYELVRGKNLLQRKKIEGLSKDRADIFPGAAATIATIVEYTGATEAIISGSGIREGLIYDYITQHYQPIEDILEFSLHNLMNRFNLNKRHARQVFQLTKSLYEQLHELHNIDGNFEKIIKTATLLHDCGVQLRYYNHHEHSFYIILNSVVNGLTHRELLLSAYIAANHRKDQFEIDWMKYEALIDKNDLEIAREIMVLLKIAENLDRSKTNLVRQIRCQITDDEVIMQIFANVNADLEIFHASLVAKQFKKVYGKKLRII